MRLLLLFVVCRLVGFAKGLEIGGSVAYAGTVDFAVSSWKTALNDKQAEMPADALLFSDNPRGGFISQLFQFSGEENVEFARLWISTNATAFYRWEVLGVRDVEAVSHAWQKLGIQTCYTDDGSMRNATLVSNAMDYELCDDFCEGYVYMAIKGNECYCGDVYSGSAAYNMCAGVRCPRNSDQFCGGNPTVFRLLYATPRNYSLDAPSFVGCFADVPGNPDLNATIYTGQIALNSPAVCNQRCARHGFKYFGLQGSVCTCGDGYGKHGSSGACATICPGNAGETCGGANANSVYEVHTTATAYDVLGVVHTLQPAPLTLFLDRGGTNYSTYMSRVTYVNGAAVLVAEVELWTPDPFTIGPFFEIFNYGTLESIPYRGSSVPSEIFVIFEGTPVTGSGVLSPTLVTSTTVRFDCTSLWSGHERADVNISMVIVNEYFNYTTPPQHYGQYIPPPVLERMEPPQVPEVGRHSVLFFGTGFFAGCTYEMSEDPARNLVSLTYVNSTTLSASVDLEYDGVDDDLERSFSLGINPFPTSTCPAASTFTVQLGVPSLLAVDPPRISATGGQLITVSGTGFGVAENDVAVSVGGVPCTDVTYLSSTNVTCIAPALLPGLHQINMTTEYTGAEKRKVLIRVSEAPSITAVTPPDAMLAGGRPLTVHGVNFGWEATAATITVGGQACDNTTWISDVMLRCSRLPSSSHATVAAVVASTASAGSTAPYVGVSYQPDPVIFSVSPSSSPVSGGVSVVLNCSRVGSAGSVVDVFVNGVPCLTSRRLTDTTALCVVPPGMAGAANVSLTSSTAGAAVLAHAFVYFTTPSPPTNVAAEAEAAGAFGVTALVTFDAPADDGGADVLFYNVEQRPGGVSTVSVGTAVAIEGLLRGTTYTFSVVAVNAAGSSPSSAPSPPLSIDFSACPPGTERVDSDCVICPLGRFSEHGEACKNCTMEEECEQCDPVLGLCVACAVGAGIPRDRGCFIRYSKPPETCTNKGQWWSPDGECMACPAGGVCAGGGLVHPTPGYWSVDPFTAPVRCEVAEACPGSDPNALLVNRVANTQVCAEGYDPSSPRCTRCAPFYEKDGMSPKCIPCTQEEVSTRLWSVATLGGFLLLTLCVAIALLDLSAVYVLLNGILALQKLALSGRTVAAFTSSAPSFYQVAMGVLSVFSFDVVFLRTECAGETSDSSRTFQQVFVDSMLAVAVAVPFVIVAELFGMVNRQAYSRPGYKTALAKRIANSLFMVATLAYLQVCVRCFQATHCTRLEDGGTLYLALQSEVPCFAPPHAAIYGVAVVLLVVFGAGFPVALAFALAFWSTKGPSKKVAPGDTDPSPLLTNGAATRSSAPSLPSPPTTALAQDEITAYHVFSNGLRPHRLWYRVVDFALMFLLAFEAIFMPSAETKVALHLATFTTAAIVVAAAWPYTYAGQNLFQAVSHLFAGSQAFIYFADPTTGSSWRLVVCACAFTGVALAVVAVCAKQLLCSLWSKDRPSSADGDGNDVDALVCDVKDEPQVETCPAPELSGDCEGSSEEEEEEEVIALEPFSLPR